MDDVLKAFGGAGAQKGGTIELNSQDIAENGAVVPVSVTSKIPKTEQIAVMVEKNPNALSCLMSFPAGTEPRLSSRVKMGQTSNIHALVKADGKWYLASKEVKVSLGGCGG